MKALKTSVALLAALGLVACGSDSKPAPKATIVVQGQVQGLPGQAPAVSTVEIKIDGTAVQGSPFTMTEGRFGPFTWTVAPGSHAITASATDGTATFTAAASLEATLAGPNSATLKLVDSRYKQGAHTVPVVQSITASPAALLVIEGPAPATPTSALGSSVFSFDAGATLSYAWTDTCGGTFDPADGASPVYTPPAYVDSLAKTCTIELTATAAGVSDPVFSKATTTIAVSYIIPNAMTATVATAAFDEKDVVGVDSDGAPGFGTGSFASGGTSKTDIHLLGLFEGEVTLGDIAGMAYWTKKGTTHVENVADWAVTIYTKPYAGQTTGWYGQRIGAEPYFAKNLNDPANTWNQWSTNGAQNQLRFYESTNGYFGASTDPDWATFVQGNSLALTGRPSVPYATQPILYISIQTGSATAPGFTGQVDGFQIWLKDGRSATVNFEAAEPVAIKVDPTMTGFGTNVAGVAGDAPTGFGTGSYAANGTGTGTEAKAELYFDPAALFGGPVTLGDIAGFSYWTKKGTAHTGSDVGDWYVNIYTAKYLGQTSGWYGARIGAEPYLAANLEDPANTWNQWSTDGAKNQLRFFESTNNYFGSGTDPDWATFVQGNSLAVPASGRLSVPYATQQILSVSIQTGSAWASGFTGQVDGFQIWLKDGRSATVNFEP